MKVASFVAFVVIATSARLVCSYGCQKASKTRSNKNECSSGNLFKVNSKLARAGEIPEGSKVCRKHKNVIENADNRCSFPSDRHTSTLVPIPSRLFSALDEYGKEKQVDKPGTMWCTNCRKVGEEVLKSKEEYKPPSKRKRAPEINKISQDYKQQLERVFVITSSPVFRLSSTIDCVKEQLDDMQSDWGTKDYRKLLKTLQYHIQTLCFRVNCLEKKMPTEIETDHGKVLVYNGEVAMDPEVFNRIMSSIDNNKGINLYEQLSNFQVALHNYYSDGGTPLYSPTMMREFTGKVSPGLFENILNLILKKEHKKERASLQELRAVVLLHTLAYFRSQKTSTFQKDVGTFLNQHGLTRAGINTGPVLGLSTATRTHDHHVQQMSENYAVYLEAKISSSVQQNITLVDNYYINNRTFKCDTHNNIVINK